MGSSSLETVVFNISNRAFYELDEIGNNANIGIGGFTVWKQKIPVTKCYPQWELKPGLWLQVQHSPFWANWVFAYKTDTLGSLCSHALLVPTKSYKSKNQVIHKQKFRDPLSSTSRLAQKGEC